MTDKDVKKIAQALDERIKPLIGEVARVKTELSGAKTNQFGIYTELSKIGKDIARIDGTLETINEEVGSHTRILNQHTKVLKKHTKILADHSRKLKALWEQTEKVTFELEEVKEILDTHTVALKRIEERSTDDIGKINIRLITTENQLGIVPLPELTIAR